MSSSKTDIQEVQTESNHNIWMVTFMDLTMLLLAFFVMSLAMKSMDAKETKNMFGSISKEGPLESMKPEIIGIVKETAGDNLKAVLIENRDMLSSLFDLTKDISQLTATDTEEKKISEIFQIEETLQGTVLSFSAEELFEPGKSEIKPQKTAILDVAGRLLQKTSNDVLILGNENPASFPFDKSGSARSISFYRSLNIFYYLSDTAGLKPNRFGVGGYGNYPGDDKKSGRIEFILRKTSDFR